MRNTLRIEIEDVSHSPSLLEKELASGHIGVIADGHRPPCLSPVPVDSVRAHGHARTQCVGQALVLESVEHQTAYSGSESPVRLVLEHARILSPGIQMRGEGFRRHDITANQMGCGRALGSAEGSVEPIPVCPEFSHRDICGDCKFHVLGRVHVVRLDREKGSVSVGIFLDRKGMVLDGELLGSEPDVEEEALADFPVAHNDTRIYRIIRLRIIAPALSELLPEGGGPVLRPHLPAVHVEVLYPAEAVGPVPYCFEKLVRKILEMGKQSLPVELVALHAYARERCRTGCRSIVAAGETHDGPLSLRGIPLQIAVRCHQGRQVYDVGRIDSGVFSLAGADALRPEILLDSRLGAVWSADVQSLLLGILYSFRTLRCRECQDCHILMVLFPVLLHLRRESSLSEERRIRCRHVQMDFHLATTAHPSGGRDEMLHAPGRFHPRSATSGPARAYSQNHLYVKSFAFADSETEEFGPFFAHEIHGASRHTDSYLQEDDIADAGVPHGFQVLCYSIL